MDLTDIELIFGQLSTALDGIAEAAILVGSNGRVMVMNDVAESLFQPDSILTMDDGGKIALRSSRDTLHLHTAIQSASHARKSGEIVVNNIEADRRVMLSLLPLAAGRNQPVMLTLKALTVERVSLEALQQAFGLTPAELRLTALLANGASLKQAAETLGVSYWTVVTQVKSCYQKTGTHRQAELVSLALRFTGR
jgi:DNA-binding CsgD family transcriptional regulator